MDIPSNNLSSIVNAFTSYNSFVSGRPVVTTNDEIIIVGVGNKGCITSHDLFACMIGLNEIVEGNWKFQISHENGCASYKLDRKEVYPKFTGLPDLLAWTGSKAIYKSDVENCDFNWVMLRSNQKGLNVICYNAYYDETEGENTKYDKNCCLFLRIITVAVLIPIAVAVSIGYRIHIWK